MNSNLPPGDLNPIALPESVLYVSDLLVFGIQEAPQGNAVKEWEIDLQKTIGPTHVLLYSTTHGALHLCIFVKRFYFYYYLIKELIYLCQLHFNRIKKIIKKIYTFIRN